MWPERHPINIGPHCVTGFLCGSAGKESACNVGDLGAIPGLGRSPGEGKGSPLQYSGLENSMDCIVHGVAKSWTRLRLSLFPVLEHLYFFSIRLMIPSCACFSNAQKWLHGSLGGITGVTVVFTGIFTLVR